MQRRHRKRRGEGRKQGSANSASAAISAVSGEHQIHRFHLLWSYYRRKGEGPIDHTPGTREGRAREEVAKSSFKQCTQRVSKWTELSCSDRQARLQKQVCQSIPGLSISKKKSQLEARIYIYKAEVRSFYKFPSIKRLSREKGSSTREFSNGQAPLYLNFRGLGHIFFSIISAIVCFRRIKS